MASTSGGIGIIPPGENKLSVATQPGGQWEDYFGLPRGGVIPTNPYASHPRETLTLPEVYKGSNPYLTNILITIITEEELVPTRILLPIRTTQVRDSLCSNIFMSGHPQRKQKNPKTLTLTHHFVPPVPPLSGRMRPRSCGTNFTSITICSGRSQKKAYLA